MSDTDDEGATHPLLDALTGEFVRERLLGRGGYGEVWLAHQPPPLARPVALKLLLPGSSFAQLSLRHEAGILARLKHPNVVHVYDWREVDGRPILILEYVAGGSFRDRVLKSGPLSWELAGRYIADAAEGLLEVHRRGIVHRDIKPANLLWDNADGRDECVLTDFGVAARLGDPGSLAGTAAYMAPEVLQVRPPSPDQDVYGLAASVFWLIAGVDPFALPVGIGGGRPTIEQLRAEFVPLVKAGLPVGDPRCAGMPATLEKVIRDGLAYQPENRPTPADFLRDLRGALNQSLADALPTIGTPASAQPLRVMVTRTDASTAVAVDTSGPASDITPRDMKRVPARPDRVRLRTGDMVRIEVVANRDGFVSVFNVGPTGTLNPLCPESVSAPPVPVRAGRPLHVLDVRLEPPAGRERVFAVWTADARPLLPTDMKSLSEGSAGYVASRNLVKVKERVSALSASERAVAVLEIEHEG